MAAVLLLYLCNRLLFQPLTTGPLHQFFAWYFNDILAGALILSVSNLLLTLGRLPALTRPLPVTAFLLLCGLFWEFAAPLYKPGAVCDPLDLAAYLAGAWVCLGLFSLLRRRRGPSGRPPQKGA